MNWILHTEVHTNRVSRVRPHPLILCEEGVVFPCELGLFPCGGIVCAAGVAISEIDDSQIRERDDLCSLHLSEKSSRLMAHSGNAPARSASIDISDQSSFRRTNMADSQVESGCHRQSTTHSTMLCTNGVEPTSLLPLSPHRWANAHSPP